MPNHHAPDKEPLSLQIPRTLMGRLKRGAKSANMALTEYVTSILNNGVKNVTLKPEDYEAIAAATREAEKTGKRCATKFISTERTQSNVNG